MPEETDSWWGGGKGRVDTNVELWYECRYRLDLNVAKDILNVDRIDTNVMMGYQFDL